MSADALAWLSTGISAGSEMIKMMVYIRDPHPGSISHKMIIREVTSVLICTEHPMKYAL